MSWVSEFLHDCVLFLWDVKEATTSLCKKPKKNVNVKGKNTKDDNIKGQDNKDNGKVSEKMKQTNGALKVIF